MEVSDHKTYRIGILLLVIGASIISFSPVFVKLAHVGPTMVGFYRMLFGGVLLVIVAVVRGESLWRGWRPFGWASLAAAFMAVDLMCWHRSVHYIGPGLSTILGNFQVFFLAAFGITVLHERVDWKYLVSIPIAILGLVMLIGVDWDSLGSDYQLGVILGVVTAITYAAYVLILQRAQREIPRLSAAANLAVISLVCALILCIAGPIQGESFDIPDFQSWASLLGLGIVCQAIGWIIISHGLARVAASRAGLILLLQPMLAFVWDIVLFGRPTKPIEVVGALLAVAAIYLGSTRKR